MLPTTTTLRTRLADPRVIAVGGSAAIAFSPIFIALSGATPGTATFFRCLLALPMLLPLALVERRRRRRTDAAPSGRRPGLLVAAGLLLGLDMTLWADSLHAVGAGVSTVLVNAQVVILPVLAFAVLGERVRTSFVVAVPIMLAGVGLAGGLIGGGGATAGADPVRGVVTGLLAACCYAGYLLLIRLGAGRGERFSPVAIATAAATASALVLGSLWQGVDLAPGWASLGWLALLALVGQVLGWVLLATALPRLASSTGASILLLQPVAAVGMGMLILGEHPTLWQLAGCAVVIGAVVLAVRTRASD